MGVQSQQLANISYENPESDTVQNVTFSGPFLSNQSGTIWIRRMGTMVYLELGAVSGGALLSLTNNAVATGAIPVGYMPPATIYGMVPIISAGLLLGGVGKLEIGSNGDIKIYAGLTELVNFATTGTNGWQKTSMFWFANA